MKFQRAIITDCKPCPNYKIWIRFNDGLEGKVDLSNFVGKGLFSAWNSVDFFNTVYIDPKTQTIAWGDDLDLDPYVLREQISQQKHTPQ